MYEEETNQLTTHRTKKDKKQKIHGQFSPYLKANHEVIEPLSRTDQIAKCWSSQTTHLLDYPPVFIMFSQVAELKMRNFTYAR